MEHFEMINSDPWIDVLFPNNMISVVENLKTNLSSGAQNHLSYHQQATVDWSKKTFKPVCLETKYRNGDTSKPYIVVKRYLPSLNAMRLPLYASYSKEEKEILTPQLLRT